MHPELLVLSGEVALLVLLASVFAALIAWWWRGQQVRASSQETDAEHAKLQSAETTILELKASLAESEQQCIAALEQRDEAERLSLQRAADTRQLQQKIADAELAIAERDALRTENASLKTDASSMLAIHEALVAEAAAAAARLEHAAAELAALRQSHAEALRSIEAIHLKQFEEEQALRIEQQHQVKRLVAEAAQAAQQSDALARQLAAATARITELEQAAIETKRDAPKPATVPMAIVSLPPEAPPQSTDAEDFTAFPSAPSRDVVPVVPKAKKIARTEASHAAADAKAGPTITDREALVTRIAAEREQLTAELSAHDPHALDRIGLTRIRIAETEKRLNAAIADRDRAQRQAHAIAQADEGASDDLTRIKGIKSTLMKKLHGHGIHTFRQIAEWTDDDAAAIGALLAFKNRISKDRWREQARELQAAKQAG
jgi:predicted flap endonuclease-1-like 5' DNA nuclease